MFKVRYQELYGEFSFKCPTCNSNHCVFDEEIMPYWCNFCNRQMYPYVGEILKNRVYRVAFHFYSSRAGGCSNEKT